MKTYPKMKDSSIEWIGEIPEHWEKKKLSWSFNFGSGTTPDSNNEKFYDGKIPWVNTGDLNDDIVKKTEHHVTEIALKEYSPLKIFPKNTLIIAMYGATIGKLGILDMEAVTNQACCNLYDSKDIQSKFMFYWFLAYRKKIISLAQGGGQPNINQGMIKKLKIFVPDLEEQTKIEKFLDSEIIRINLEISKNQKLTDLLKEMKQSMINQVVTKGLDPSSPMKDSGIEMIGKIPEHWILQKIKHSSYVKGRIGWQGLKSDEFTDEGPFLITGTDFKNGEINWDTCNHVEQWRYDQDPYIQLKENDVLVTKDGTIGKIALIHQIPDKTTLNSGVMVVRPLYNIYIPEFLFWILESQQFTEFINMIKTGTTINHLYQETFGNFQFALPKTHEEQIEIINFIRDKSTKINFIMSKTESRIKKLQEFRQSLIASAVTGKIDVREAVA